MNYFHCGNKGRKGFAHHWYKKEGWRYGSRGFILLFFERSQTNRIWAVYKPMYHGSLFLLRVGYFMVVLSTCFPHFMRRY